MPQSMPDAGAAIVASRQTGDSSSYESLDHDIVLATGPALATAIPTAAVPVILIAVAAVHGPAPARLERHAGWFSTIGANGRIQPGIASVDGRPIVGAARNSVGRAAEGAAGRRLESLLSESQLFAACQCELLPAIAAGEGFVLDINHVGHLYFALSLKESLA